MKILVVNDDGFTSTNTIQLMNLLKKDHDVKYILPAENKSGSSSSVTCSNKYKYLSETLSGIVLEGTPVDCIKVALRENPDLIITGPNKGHNISYDIVCSGTVQAAQFASLSGVKAIALAVDFDDLTPDLEHFVEILHLLIDLIPDKGYLNVNMPKNNLREILETLLYPALLFNTLQKLDTTISGLCSIPNDCDLDIKYDLGAIVKGYISYTPLVFNGICVNGK